MCPPTGAWHARHRTTIRWPATRSSAMHARCCAKSRMGAWAHVTVTPTTTGVLVRLDPVVMLHQGAISAQDTETLTPLSAIGQSFEVNPITGLVPLCPNCHSVVHLVDPPYSIKQVKNMLASQAHPPNTRQQPSPLSTQESRGKTSRPPKR
jgi:hypothetical protein